MKKSIACLLFLSLLADAFETAGQCSNNFSSGAVLRKMDGTLNGNARVTGDTDYYVEFNVNPPMASDQVLVVIAYADGFGKIPCTTCPFQYIPPAIGQDTGPSAYPITKSFLIHTVQDADLAQFLYFRVRTECGSNYPRKTGANQQYYIATNR